MCNKSTVRIPLRAHDGTIRAYTIIDADDAAFASQWRWSLSKGYAGRKYARDGKQYGVLLHRELLGLTQGDGLEGDHINRDPLDNRRCNLRIVTKRGNRQNRGSLQGSSSSYRGVSWDKYRKRWRACIWIDGKQKLLGRFMDESEAAMVAKEARAQLFPCATD